MATNATTAVPTTAASSNVHPRDILNRYLWWVLIFVVVITLVFGIKHKIESRKDADSDHSRATELSLKIEPNGDSSHVVTKSGYAIDYKGSGFVLYCVYADGHKGMNDGRVNTCGNGPMLYQYLHDTSGKENTVPYEYVRKS